jgi:uncharacterized membrane protein
MEKLKNVWHEIRDSLWFLPSLLTLAGGTAALLLMRHNDDILGDVDARDLWWVFGGGSDGAQSVLQVISGSLITVTGVIFSVTMIVLQLASSQFTPRVLRQFMADRSNQLVLGVFIGTFTYTLIVLRSVRGDATGEEYVPQVAVTGAVVLALVSIGFLIYFINHIARSVQAAVVIDTIARDTLNVVCAVYPERLNGETRTSGRGAPPRTDGMEPADGAEVVPILMQRAGYLQGIDYDALREIAAGHHLAICVELEIGTFVLAGQHVASVQSDRGVPERAIGDIRDALVIGPERTPRQDLKYGVLELMDIAVKAMSPSVNDPTTAVNSIHRLGEVLLELAWRADGDRIIHADDGTELVRGRRPLLEDTIGLAFNQIRHYSAENATVMIVLLRTLGELAALAPPHARAAFVEQLNDVHTTARARISDTADRERLEEAAAHALGRAATPDATYRARVSSPG